MMLHFLLEKTGDQNKTVLVTMAAMTAARPVIMMLFACLRLAWSYPSDSVVGDRVLTKTLPQL